MSTLINHISEIVLHLFVSDKFKIDRIENGIFRVIIFPVLLGFKGKLFEVLISLTIWENFTNQLLDNVQKLRWRIVKETNCS